MIPANLRLPFALLASALLSCALSPWASAQEATFLVRPYLQFATQHSITVLFETAEPSTAVLEYGPALEKAESPNWAQKIEVNPAKTLHEITISGLSPATKYLYRVRAHLGNGKTAESEVLTFSTAVRDEDPFVFAVIGDTQFNGRTSWAWEKIAQRVWESRPHFVVHLGDVVDKGSVKTDWTQDFFPKGQPVLSRYSVYTVLGNHEQDAAHYYDYMANPEPEYYYTFKYGNAQFFMLDTNRDVFPGSEQYDWLEWALAASDAQWKFVVHHHPPYSSEENDHGDTYIGASTFQTQARALVPLYEAYGVDFCLFGHTHVYERTWPIFEDKVDRSRGVVYINSGGAGGGLEGFDPVRPWFSLANAVTHHFCTFAIHEDYLAFKAIDHEGRLFDQFQLTKGPGTGVASVRPAPPAPHFEVDKAIFERTAEVRLLPYDDAHRMVYTTDGSTPTASSALYEKALTVRQSMILQARAIAPDGQMSRVVSRQLQQMDAMPSIKPSKAAPGLSYAYFEGEWEDHLPDFGTLTPLRTGVADQVSLDGIPHREDQFGLVMTGYVKVPEQGAYTFYTRSDDGSKLYINGREVVDNDGNHGAFYRYGTAVLMPGKHELRIEYFDAKHEQMLEAGLRLPSGERVPFSAAQLSH